MKPATKVTLAAGATVAWTVASIVLFAGKAEAEPVMSSWYGSGFEGAVTSSGEVFRAGERTAAHPSLPFGTQLLVTYGGQQAVVRITDRGPFGSGRGLDLSQTAAEEIGLTGAGADTVDMQVLGAAGHPATDYRVRSPERTSGSSGSAREWGVETLREHPHLKVLGASFTPYSRPASRACQGASMETPTAGAPSISTESRKSEIVATVARCSANKARPLA
jgi:rare lipoprotein A